MSLAFELPKEHEARRPPELRGLSRDGVTLLVSSVRWGTHDLARFTDLPRYLHAGDLLVVNDSATIPAELDARRSNGAYVVLHLSTRISESLWIVEPRETPLISAGERLSLPANGTVRLIAPVYREHPRLWFARLELPMKTAAYLAENARPIAYGHLDGRYPIEMYQTIFARVPGSVEMPSAGRPFTLRAIDALYRANIDIAALTLHCGVASPQTHEPPLDERFTVPQWTAEAVNAARERGSRVIAAGTTVVRALESAGRQEGRIRAMSGWTSHIVDRVHPPHVVDGLLTGFHEPRASHLNMLEAFAPSAFLSDAYEVALRENLLWHEFGDVHLVLR